MAFQVILVIDIYLQKTPQFIHSLAQKAKFGEEEPKENLRDNAFVVESMI